MDPTTLECRSAGESLRELDGRQDGRGLRGPDSRNLERLWGGIPNDDVALRDEAPPHVAKAGAPTTMDDAVASFHRLFPNGKPHDTTWRIIAKRVSEDVERSISYENLTAAIRNRRVKARGNT